MDRLDDLPEKEDAAITPQEKVLITRFFGKEQQPAEDKKKSKWKFIGYVMIAFILLANPWIDNILGVIPNCGSPLAKLGLKAMVFFITLYLLLMYCY